MRGVRLSPPRTAHRHARKKESKQQLHAEGKYGRRLERRERERERKRGETSLQKMRRECQDVVVV